jgi:hypothetical protein
VLADVFFSCLVWLSNGCRSSIGRRLPVFFRNDLIIIKIACAKRLVIFKHFLFAACLPVKAVVDRRGKKCGSKTVCTKT